MLWLYREKRRFMIIQFISPVHVCPLTEDIMFPKSRFSCVITAHSVMHQLHPKVVIASPRLSVRTFFKELREFSVQYLCVLMNTWEGQWGGERECEEEGVWVKSSPFQRLRVSTEVSLHALCLVRVTVTHLVFGFCSLKSRWKAG